MFFNCSSFESFFLYPDDKLMSPDLTTGQGLWVLLMGPTLFDTCFWHHDDIIHQMETFSMLLTICVGNSSVIGEFPAQSPVTRSFDVFFDLRLNKRLSKHLVIWDAIAPIMTSL